MCNMRKRRAYLGNAKYTLTVIKADKLIKKTPNQSKNSLSMGTKLHVNENKHVGAPGGKMAEDSGTELRDNNEKIVRLISRLRKDRKEMNFLIEKQELEKGRIQTEIEKLSFKLSLLTKSLGQRLVARNNYDRTIQEIEMNYGSLVSESSKLLITINKEVSDLENIMDKKIGTGSITSADRAPSEISAKLSKSDPPAEGKKFYDLSEPGTENVNQENPEKGNEDPIPEQDRISVKSNSKMRSKDSLLGAPKVERTPNGVQDYGEAYHKQHSVPKPAPVRKTQKS